MLSISAGTLSTRRRGNDAAFNHIVIDPDELIIRMVSFDGAQYVDSEIFRKPRRELNAWRRDGDIDLRKNAKVLDTQDGPDPV